MLKPNLAIIRMRSAVALMPLAAALQSSAAQFTAEGHGEARLFQEGGLRETQTATFSVTVNETNWFITVKQTGSSMNYQNAAWLEYQVFRQDSNTVTLGYFDPATVERGRQVPNHGQMRGMAWIERSTVPRGDSSIWIAPLWYGFCSATYLAQQSEGLIEPPYNLDGDVEYYQNGNTHVNGRWRIATGGMGLPDEIHFLHSGRGRDPQGNVRALPKPFDAGFTNATLRTRFVAAGHEPERPDSISFQVSYPERRSGGNPVLATVLEVDLKVDQFGAAAAAVDRPPELAGTFSFTDRRFMNPGFENARLNYSTNRILSDEEAGALPQFAFRQQQALRAAAHRKTSTTIRVVFFGIMACGVAGIVWLVRSRNNHQPKRP